MKSIKSLKNNYAAAFMVVSFLLLLTVLWNGFLRPCQKTNTNSNNTNVVFEKDVIGSDGRYYNNRYGFTLIFPENWTGCRFEDNNDETVFSLKNKSGEYVQVAKISAIPWEDPVPENAYILFGPDNHLIMSALVNEDASQFGGAFAAVDYPGILGDLEHQVSFVSSDPSIKSKYTFRFSDIKVGDRAGDMTVESVSPEPGETNASKGLASTNPVDMIVKFSGKVVVTGGYKYGIFDSNKNSFGDLCFVESADPFLLPAIVGYASPKLCFSNQDDAKKIFSPEGSKGSAVIEIDDFTLHIKPDGSVESSARLSKLISSWDSNDEFLPDPDTSDWIVHRSDVLGVSIKAPKQVFYFSDKAILQFTDNKRKNEMSIFVNSGYGTDGLDFQFFDVEDDKGLDSLIRGLVEGGTGCRLGTKNLWKYQDGIYDIGIIGEDWESGADLGTTTCPWSGMYKLLYSPSKKKAVYVILGQENRFYLDSNYQNGIDGLMVSTLHFE